MNNTDSRRRSVETNMNAAKRLIQMDANGMIDKVAKSAKDSGKMAYDEEGFVVSNLSESSRPAQQYAPQEEQLPMASAARQNIQSRIPSVILESMTNNPIDTSLLNGGMDGNGSILDQMNVTDIIQENSGRLMGTNPQSSKRQLREVGNESIGGVDYERINQMIEENVRKYTKSLYKSLLKEEKSKGFNIKALRLGDTFSFITENGDLYEATLTFKRNITK